MVVSIKNFLNNVATSMMHFFYSGQVVEEEARANIELVSRVSQASTRSRSHSSDGQYARSRSEFSSQAQSPVYLIFNQKLAEARLMSPRSLAPDSASDFMPARFLSDEAKNIDGPRETILQAISRPSTILDDYLKAHGESSLNECVVVKTLGDRKRELQALQQNPQSTLEEYDRLLIDIRFFLKAFEYTRDPCFTARYRQEIERLFRKLEQDIGKAMDSVS